MPFNRFFCSSYCELAEIGTWFILAILDLRLKKTKYLQEGGLAKCQTKPKVKEMTVRKAWKDPKDKNRREEKQHLLSEEKRRDCQ